METHLKPDLLQIIDNHKNIVSTNKIGSTLYITCPWHEDKKPSCLVYPEDKRIWCPVCDKGCDSVQYLAELNGKENNQVATQILKNQGMSIQYPSPKQDELKTYAERWVWGMREGGKLDENVKINNIYPVHLAEEGSPLFGAMLRLEPKSFRQCTIVDDVKKPGKKKFVGSFKLLGRKMLPFGWQSSDKSENLIIVEGQKAATTLQQAAIDQASVISLNGAGTVNKIDWSLVAEKKVYLWADNDDTGLKAMKKLQKLLTPLKSKSIALITPQWEGIEAKDDAHDYVIYCESQGIPFDLENLLKTSKKDEKPIFVDFDEKGKPEETNENFDIMCEFYDVQPMIDVFSKESGLVDLKNREMLYDADVLTFCSKARFPKQNRMSFIERPLKKNPTYLNRFKDKLDSMGNPSPVAKGLINNVIKAFKFKENVLGHFLSEEGEGSETRDKYLTQIFETWFKLVYFQGCILNKKKEVPRTVLLLKGVQSLGKTRWFDTITPEGFFHEGAGLPSDGDEKDQVTQSLITELGEFDNMSAQEQGKAKNLISVKADRYRKKYGRETLTFPRVTTFVATTNRNKFFRDSENTRFWTLNVDSINRQILNTALPDEEAKWAFWKQIEVMFHHDGGIASLFRSVDEINRIFEIENEKYRFTDYTEDLVEDAFDIDKMKEGVFDYYIKKKDLYKLISFRENGINTSKEMGYAIVHFYERLKLPGSISVKVRPLDRPTATKKPMYAYPVTLREDDFDRFEHIKKYLFTK